MGTQTITPVKLYSPNLLLPESSLWLKPTPSSCYAHLKSPHCCTLFLTTPQQILYTFKIHTEFDPFSLFPPLLSWWKPPRLTCIIALASWPVRHETWLPTPSSAYSQQSFLAQVRRPPSKSQSCPCSEPVSSTLLSSLRYLSDGSPPHPFSYTGLLAVPLKGCEHWLISLQGLGTGCC